MYFELQNDSIDSFCAQRFEPHSFYAAVQSFVELWFSEVPIRQKTSGSTGVPKEIEIDRAAMRASARMTCAHFGLRRGETALLCLSVSYIAGKMMIVRALESGLRLFLVEPQGNPLAQLDVPIRFAAMIPTQVWAAIQDLDRIDELIIGGAATPAPLAAALQQKRTRCWATYGMTETLSHVALRPLNGVNRRALYRGLPGVRFAQDERGCLVVEASALGIRKWTTNDVVDRVGETEFRWLGRIDNAINSGGIKVFPERIEEELSRCFSHRFFIGKEPDPKWGEKLILLVEGSPFSLERSFFQGMGLMPYEIPKTVYFLPRFVETPSGKIQRAETLRRLVEDKIAGCRLK
ncbi:MAG: AMP-binding protein [Flavobacteriales bacterium]